MTAEGTALPLRARCSPRTCVTVSAEGRTGIPRPGCGVDHTVKCATATDARRSRLHETAHLVLAPVASWPWDCHHSRTRRGPRLHAGRTGRDRPAPAPGQGGEPRRPPSGPDSSTTRQDVRPPSTFTIDLSPLGRRRRRGSPGARSSACTLTVTAVTAAPCASAGRCRSLTWRHAAKDAGRRDRRLTVTGAGDGRHLRRHAAVRVGGPDAGRWSGVRLRTEPKPGDSRPAVVFANGAPSRPRRGARSAHHARRRPGGAYDNCSYSATRARTWTPLATAQSARRQVRGWRDLRPRRPARPEGRRARLTRG